MPGHYGKMKKPMKGKKVVGKRKAASKKTPKSKKGRKKWLPTHFKPIETPLRPPYKTKLYEIFKTQY